MRSRIHENACDPQPLHDEGCDLDLSGETCDASENTDEATGSRCLHRRGHRRDAGRLDHDVRASAPGDLEDGFVPARVVIVVDTVIGAELPGAREFVIARRGDDDFGAEGLRELNGEDRNAARSERQRLLAFLNLAFGDEHAPRRERRDRQCRRLREIVAVAHRHHRAIGQHDALRRKAGPRAAEGRARMARLERAVRPIRG